MRMFGFILLIGAAQIMASSDQIPMVQNLVAEATHAEDNGMVYLLYVSRSACPYCKKLEQNVLFPMRASKSYEDLVDLREISFEGGSVVDFDNKTHPSIDIIRRFDVVGTPTLLFLDSSGAEISERLVGYHSEDFYWYYFEQSIEKALEVINP
jgi:thioredoxin-related protein